MSPRKLNTGVLFRGPRHTRNPQARSHVRSAFTRTTRIVGRKPNHGKPAKRNKFQLGYAPNDHSTKTRCKPERGLKIYLAPRMRLGHPSNVKSSLTATRHVIRAVTKFQLPLAVNQGNARQIALKSMHPVLSGTLCKPLLRVQNTHHSVTRSTIQAHVAKNFKPFKSENVR